MGCGDLNRTADDAYAALVNIPPDIESAANQGLPRVDDFDPDDRFLLIRLIGVQVGTGAMRAGAPAATRRRRRCRH
jgi:hypothetical protein